jgi:hypothetical protein
MFRPIRHKFHVTLFNPLAFNDVAPIFKSMYCGMRNDCMVMSGRLRIIPMWKEAIMVYCRLLFTNLLGETNRNDETPQTRLFSSDVRPSEYKTNSDPHAELGNAVIS